MAYGCFRWLSLFSSQWDVLKSLIAMKICKYWEGTAIIGPHCQFFRLPPKTSPYGKEIFPYAVLTILRRDSEMGGWPHPPPRIKLKTRKMKAIFVKSFTLFFHYLFLTNVKHIKDKMGNSYICLLLSCENCWNTSLNAVLRSRLCPFVPSGCFSHHLLKLQTRLLSQPSC